MEEEKKGKLFKWTKVSENEFHAGTKKFYFRIIKKGKEDDVYYECTFIRHIDDLGNISEQYIDVHKDIDELKKMCVEINEHNNWI